MPDPTDGATIVVASYNHASVVDECLASVAAQTMQGLRVVVTDDASTDGSRQAIEGSLRRLGLTAETIFHERNHGICATFNHALAEVDTPFVAFISADDWMHPDRMRRQSQALEAAGEGTALLYGDAWWVEPGREPDLVSSHYPACWGFGSNGPDLFSLILEHNFIPAPSAMVRTEQVRAVGGYDEDLVYEDHDMWLRLSRRWSVGFLAEPLVSWRVSPCSLGAELRARRQREFHVSNLRLLGRHADVVGPTGDLVRSKLLDNARMAYRLGANTPDVRRVLRSGAARGSAREALVAVAATMRFPGNRIRRG